MKILIITPNYYPRVGGVEVVVKEVTERLAQRGHACTLLTLNSCAVQEEEELNGVHIKRFSSRISKHMFELSPEMLLYCVRNRRAFNTFDVVHIHNYHSLLSLQMTFLLKDVVRTKGRVFFSPYYHATGHTRRASLLLKILRPFGRWILRKADAFICISDYEASLVQRDFSVPRDRVWTIPIGVGSISRKRKEKERGEPISLLYVGRVEEYKGIQHIVEAMAKLKEVHNVSSSLTIVGGGDYANELRTSIKRLGLEGAVRWLARLPPATLDEEYANADMLLLLSKAESYGLVVAEALAHGTPCIVSKSSALVEFLQQPGCFGIDYPPNDEALAKLILEVHTSGVVEGHLGRKVRVWDEVADDYLRAYYSTTST
jgi:glycosyltransferase involved in cell wall biosynthesis